MPFMKQARTLLEKFRTAPDGAIAVEFATILGCGIERK